MNEMKEIIKKSPWLFNLLKRIYSISVLPFNIYKQTQYSNALLLNTMRKSGSHYLMSILGNYFIFKFFQDTNRLGFLEMKERIWNVDKNTEELRLLSDKIGFSRFFWEHENELIKYNNAKKIIHTYRNPLDLLVSRYFYNHKNRLKDTTIAHPRELINDEINKFIKHFNAIYEIKDRENVHLVAYEDLIRNPLETSKNILEFLEIDYDEIELLKAIESSSKKNVKKDEKRYGVEGSNVVGKDMTESFVRSGKIGEWKEYFIEDDIKKVEKLLNKENISLNNFILE